MHMAEGAAQGLNLRYDLLDTDQMPPDTPLTRIVDQAEKDGYAGLNITFPYKQEVLALTDQLSDAARRVGAVNTLVFRDGKRLGHNTDFSGFAEGLRRGLPDVTPRRVLLVGAGGAGGALAHALHDMGATDLMITDRRIEAAVALAEAVNAAANALGVDTVAHTVAHTVARAVPHTKDHIAPAIEQAEGIVNATPMGMAKLPGTPIDTTLLSDRHWVGDIVYFPRETEFLRAARARGCRTVDGSGMAVFQAVRAFHLFTGVTADDRRMRATFESFETA
ncbi:shikimate dehydrogenase [Phaeobacter sp. J2-8]|uniref:shikimate dehydrogenase n=1 Tax=Phaeobacter sp. J2-8 TaxID=2931394 RepID=UPI001FD42D8C|nr:shikimate dehydrogenase [Phaeobacter sp. J2-8]MCJ7874159.1 shikimate dehydrogenase [Phaeobacter sp. J2-8]